MHFAEIPWERICPGRKVHPSQAVDHGGRGIKHHTARLVGDQPTLPAEEIEGQLVEWLQGVS